MVQLGKILQATVLIPFLWLCSPISAQPLSGASLHIVYTDSPPYMFKLDDRMQGVLVKPVEAIALDIGIKISWLAMAPGRVFRFMKTTDKAYCALGDGDFFKNNHEYNWRISISFSDMGEVGILIRAKDKAKIQQYASIQDLVLHSRYRVGVMETALPVYKEEMGLHLDPSRHHISMGNPFDLGHLLARGRVDFIFVTKEAVPMHKAAYDNIEPLMFLKFPGIPQKERGTSFLCTQAVPMAMMDRLNDGISKFLAKSTN